MDESNKDGDSSNDNRPPARNAIPAYLLLRGSRAYVYQIANGTGFSHSHTRQTAVNLRDEEIISGAQPTAIIGCSVNGTTIILTRNKNDIVQKLRRCAPQHAGRAAGMPIKQLHKFVKQIAQGSWPAANRHEFWIDTDDPDQVAAARELADSVEIEADETDRAEADD